MTKKNMLSLTCLSFFGAMFSVSDLQADDTQSQTQTRYDHATLIERFESELKPRYGTTQEASPSWTLKERMAFYKVPALSIAVAINGEVAWAKAYGETIKGSNVKANTNTLFQVASLSKPVASIAALKLVSQGQLALDDPVNDYLKSWKVPANKYTEQNAVTLRHLLSHRAGTTVHGFRGYKQAEDIPSSLQIVTGEPPANTDEIVVDKVPGASYRYSGGGFQVVQLLIEDITKQRFSDYVQKSVFSPLSLTRSNFSYPQHDKNAATGHVGENSAPIEGEGLTYPELAAAGLWSTPSELVLIGSALTEDRLGANRLLPKEITRQLIPNNADENGLGFGLNNDGDGVTFVHNGHNPGFSARWINYANGKASVAVLTNADTGGQLIREVLSALGHVYGWEQDAYLERETVVLSNDWMKKVAGDYYFDANSPAPAASVEIAEDVLWIKGALTDRTRLFPLSKTRFFIENGLNLTLITNESEMPVALDVEGELELVKKD